MFQITDSAIAELQAAARRSAAEGLALRVAARALDDGEVEFGLGFDDEREHDETAEFAGLRVLLGRHSRPFLAGTTLDYVEIEPGRFDFVFVPQAPEAAPETAPEGGGCGTGGCSRCGGGS